MSNVIDSSTSRLRKLLEEYLVETETTLYNLAMQKQSLEDGLREVENRGSMYEKRMNYLNTLIEDMYEGEYLQ